MSASVIMRRRPLVARLLIVTVSALSLVLGAGAAEAQKQAKELERLKRLVIEGVEERGKLSQVMVDMIFSFGELGFQEFETSRYVTGILEEHGFDVTSRSSRNADGVGRHLGQR